MDPTVDENAEDAFAFCSSIADDVRHLGLPYAACEAWYFDALSDDGNEAVTITFLDNVFDPPRGRRNREKAETNRLPPKPGVGISYFRDGKIRYAALLEFGPESFQAS